MSTASEHQPLSSGFSREVIQGWDAVIPLPEIDCELPFADLYENVVFVKEVIDEDA